MLDDEVVEGKLRSGSQGEVVEEVARLDFAPQSPRLRLQLAGLSETVRGDANAWPQRSPGDQPVDEVNRALPE